MPIGVTTEEIEPLSDEVIQLRLLDIMQESSTYVKKDTRFFDERGKMAFALFLDIKPDGDTAKEIVELMKYTAALSMFVVDLMSVVAQQHKFISAVEGGQHGKPH